MFAKVAVLCLVAIASVAGNLYFILYLLNFRIYLAVAYNFYFNLYLTYEMKFHKTLLVHN